MRYTNFIWDFDGMLFNTYPRMLRAFQRVLHECGVNEPDEEVLHRIKITVRAARAYYVEKHHIDPAFDFAGKYHTYEVGQPIETMVPYDGIPEMLRKTHEMGAKHYLYSHRDHSALDALAYWHIDDLFEGCITADDHFAPKPAPDAILSLIAKHGFDPGSACMMGDRDIDVLCGNNAGIAGCLFDPEHFYDAFETPNRVSSVSELTEWMTGK